MPQYLFRIEPTRPDMHSTGPTPQEASSLAAHFGYLQRLQDRGVVLLAGRTLLTDAHSFGLVLLQTETESQARALMQADPAVANGVMRGDLHAFRVSLWSKEGPEAS